MTDLALLPELGERADLVLERHLAVDPVQLDQVDPVDPEVAQAELHLLLEVRRAADLGPLPGAGPGEARLGGDHQVVGVGVEGLGDQLLADDRAVAVGGVDEVHATLHGGPEDGQRSLVVLRRAPDAVAGDLHGAVAEAVHLEVAAQAEGVGTMDGGRRGHTRPNRADPWPVPTSRCERSDSGRSQAENAERIRDPPAPTAYSFRVLRPEPAVPRPGRSRCAAAQRKAATADTRRGATTRPGSRSATAISRIRSRRRATPDEHQATGRGDGRQPGIRQHVAEHGAEGGDRALHDQDGQGAGRHAPPEGRRERDGREAVEGRLEVELVGPVTQPVGQGARGSSVARCRTPGTTSTKPSMNRARSAESDAPESRLWSQPPEGLHPLLQPEQGPDDAAHHQ